MEKQNLKNTEVNLIYGVDDDLDLPKKQIELQEGMIVSANCWYRKG